VPQIRAEPGTALTVPELGTASKLVEPDSCQDAEGVGARPAELQRP